MVNRRRFIEAGTAASVAAAFGGAVLARASSGGIERGLAGASAADALRGARGGDVRPHLVLIDERFAAARAFGETMQRQGLAVHAIRGDVTEVWYARLYPLWKRTPAPIAGLTAYAAMFCLERLAWDHGLRMTRLGTDAGGAPLYSWIIAARRLA